MRAIVLLGCLTFLSAAPVAASDVPPVAEPPPLSIPEDVRTEAHALVEEQGGEQSYRATLALLRNQLVKILASASGKPIDQVGKDVDELIIPEFQAHAAQFMDIKALVYASHLSVEELRALRAFYQTPVGRKLTELGPIMAQETNAAAMTLGGQIIQDAVVKHRDELRKRGLKL